MGKGLDEVLLEGVPELCGAARAGDTSRTDTAIRRLLARLRRVDPTLSQRLEAKLPWVQGKKGSAPAVPSSLTSTGLLKDLSGGPEAPRPVLNPRQEALLETFVAEHQQPEALARMGLRPRNTLFLFARRSRALVLLDEFDAIAKRRDDPGDMGEPRRIVSVLLKEIEEWPGQSLLVAATNHLELIDEPLQPSPEIRELAAQMLSGSSGSDIRHVALESRRTVARYLKPTP